MNRLGAEKVIGHDLDETGRFPTTEHFAKIMNGHAAFEDGLLVTDIGKNPSSAAANINKQKEVRIGL